MQPRCYFFNWFYAIISFKGPELVYSGSFEMNPQQTYTRPCLNVGWMSGTPSLPKKISCWCRLELTEGNPECNKPTSCMVVQQHQPTDDIWYLLSCINRGRKADTSRFQVNFIAEWVNRLSNISLPSILFNLHNFKFVKLHETAQADIDDMGMHFPRTIQNKMLTGSTATYSVHERDVELCRPTKHTVV
jgi:hypothetical protein